MLTDRLRRLLSVDALRHIRRTVLDRTRIAMSKERDEMQDVKPFRVLYVEDEAGWAKLMPELLGGAVELEVVSRLTTAFESAMRNPPDLVLLDLSLPDSPPGETLPRMLDRGFDAPIAVVSADNSEATNILHGRALAAGAIGYISKFGEDGRSWVQNRDELRRRVLEWSSIGRRRKQTLAKIDGRFTGLETQVKATSKGIDRLEDIVAQLRLMAPQPSK